MREFLQKTYSLVSRHVTSIFFLVLPVMALAADGIRDIETDYSRSEFWVTMLLVQILWSFGYAAASLPKWARWKDGTRLERLEIISGVFASGLGGNLFYIVGVYGFDWKIIWGFVGAGAGGFGGERALSALYERYVARIGAGNNGATNGNNA